MTDSEREEFVYDLANHYVTNTTKAGLTAMAIDRMIAHCWHGYLHR